MFVFVFRPLTEELLTHVLHWYSALPIAAHWQEHIHTRVLLALRGEYFKTVKNRIIGFETF